MRQANYDKFPATKLTGTLFKGWDAILGILKEELASGKTLAVDFYTGVYEEDIYEAMKSLGDYRIYNTRNLMRPEAEIEAMTRRVMTDDVLFGYMTPYRIWDYFDGSVLEETRREIALSEKPVVIVGTGAAMFAPENSVLVYVDMARWEIQQRSRRHEVKALGIDNRNDAVSIQYKRGLFNDWRILDSYKDTLFPKVDYWLDTHVRNEPKMIDRETFMNGIDKTAAKPFRVVPFFDPAPWGGQWMKDVCDLDRSRQNYGWCFDCVPEENSLYFDVNGTLFEMPSVNLILRKSREVLGEPVEARFGKDFPIRFDFLDTMGGGNLSLQVHPTAQFVRENFGMAYTQDESYYLLDAGDDAVVYLGLKKGVDKDEMLAALRKAQAEGCEFDVEKYINKYHAKKHDHFLIPGGTIHCSGTNSMVLEISSTPNLFTFKLYDWMRLGLDGKPRPINIERGSKVIDWGRDTEYVEKYLHNVFERIGEGEGWTEEKTGLHKNEFIETRRHRFSVPVTHYTNDSVTVFNLLEGEEAIVESPTGAFEPLVVHYAETFIIPACLGTYTIRPYGKSEGKECVTVKAYIRFNA